MGYEDMHNLDRVKRSYTLYVTLANQSADYTDKLKKREMVYQFEKHMEKKLDRLFFDIFKEHIKQKIEAGIGMNSKNKKKKAKKKLAKQLKAEREKEEKQQFEKQ